MLRATLILSACALHAQVSTPQKFNLAGTWRTVALATGQTPPAFDLKVDQRDGEVSLVFRGLTMFHGTYVQNPKIAGQGQVLADGKAKWIESNLLIDDPDHVRLEDPANPHGTVTLARIS